MWQGQPAQWKGEGWDGEMGIVPMTSCSIFRCELYVSGVDCMCQVWTVCFR